MAEVESFSSVLIEGYKSVVSQFPSIVQNFINLFLLVLLILLYAVFIWKFYRFIAKKNIFGLNLNKYNKSSHPFLTKVIAGMFYLIEYIIILPFIIFFWFAVFTLFLIFLTENLQADTLLITSAVIVAAIRMASYYKEDLSKDLAKLIPFTLLAVFISNWGSFNFERVLGHFQQIPSFFSNIAIYLLFIIILEIILRFFDFIFSLFGLEEEETEESESEQESEE